MEDTENLLQDQEGAKATITQFRFTFATKQSDGTGNVPWSGHKFKVVLTGTNGESVTEQNELRYYQPSLKYALGTGKAGAMAPSLYPGKQATDCEVNTDDCKKFLNAGNTPNYKGVGGLVQHAQIETTKDIGELQSAKFIEVVPAGQDRDGWQPQFIKINTNDMKTGLGSGIYYIDPADKEFGGKANKGGRLASVPNADGTQPPDTVKMTRCKAQFCEEEMDERLGLAVRKD